MANLMKKAPEGFALNGQMMTKGSRVTWHPPATGVREPTGATVTKIKRYASGLDIEIKTDGKDRAISYAYSTIRSYADKGQLTPGEP